MTPQMQAVETYLQNNISVLPLRPDSKHPIGRWKRLQYERMAVSQAATWWNGIVKPIAGIGIVTGPISANLAVLDIEPEHVDFVRANVRIPDTGSCVTARRGLHIYCRGETRSTKLTVAGRTVGDIRGVGGYVVAPPTPIASGQYSWAVPADFGNLADMPAWAEPLAVRQALPTRSSRLILPDELHDQLSSKVQLALQQPRQLQPGSWSEWIFWVVSECVWVDVPYETIEVLLTEALPDYLEDRASRKGDAGYLMRVYEGALAHVDQEMSRAAEVCIVNMAEFGALAPRHNGPMARARVDVVLRVVTTGQIVRYRIPRVLDDGTVSVEYRQFLGAFGVYDTDELFAPRGTALAIVDKDATVRRFVAR